MKGYVIIDTEITDEQAYSEFLQQVPAVVEANGGQFIVRTSSAEAIEGGWAPKRLVIMEFESPDAARGFITSAGYTALNDLRRRAANSHIVVAEGHAPEA